MVQRQNRLNGMSIMFLLLPGGGKGDFENVHSEAVSERRSMECHCRRTTAYLSHQATPSQRDPGLIIPVAVADLKPTVRIRTYAFCHGDNFLLIRSTFILTFQSQHNYDATILRTSTQKTGPCNRLPTRTTTPRPAPEQPATPERPASPKSRLLSPEWHEICIKNSGIKVNIHREQMDAMAHRNQWRNWSKVCDMLNAERNIQESLKMGLSLMRHGIVGND